MISETTTIAAPSGPMPAYIARPSSGGPSPAVIVLEGVYGFDDEIRRMTGLLGAAGTVGIAIDYLRGKGVPEGFRSAGVVPTSPPRATGSTNGTTFSTAASARGDSASAEPLRSWWPRYPEFTHPYRSTAKASPKDARRRRRPDQGCGAPARAACC